MVRKTKADKVNIGVITTVRNKVCYIKREISKAYFLYYLTMLNKYNGIESEEYRCNSNSNSNSNINSNSSSNINSNSNSKR